MKCMGDTYTDNSGAVITTNPDGTITSPGLVNSPQQYQDPGYAQPVQPAAPPVDLIHSPLGRAVVAGFAGSFLGKILGIEGSTRGWVILAAAYAGWKGEIDLISLILPP